MFRPYTFVLENLILLRWSALTLNTRQFSVISTTCYILEKQTYYDPQLPLCNPSRSIAIEIEGRKSFWESK